MVSNKNIVHAFTQHSVIGLFGLIALGAVSCGDKNVTLSSFPLDVHGVATLTRSQCMGAGVLFTATGEGRENNHITLPQANGSVASVAFSNAKGGEHFTFKCDDSFPIEVCASGEPLRSYSVTASATPDDPEDGDDAIDSKTITLNVISDGPPIVWDPVAFHEAFGESEKVLDLDGDGDLDVYVSKNYGADGVTFFFNNGNGVFTAGPLESHLHAMEMLAFPGPLTTKLETVAYRYVLNRLHLYKDNRAEHISKLSYYFLRGFPESKLLPVSLPLRCAQPPAPNS